MGGEAMSGRARERVREGLGSEAVGECSQEVRRLVGKPHCAHHLETSLRSAPVMPS